MKQLGNVVVYWLYRVTHSGLSYLPIPITFRLGQLLGLLAWLVLPGYRKLAGNNIRIAFTGKLEPRQQRQLLRNHFTNLGGNLLSGPAVVRARPQSFTRYIDSDEISQIKQAGAAGRGVVLVISHIGNWEMLAKLVGMAPELKPATIYQRLNNSLIDAHVCQSRAAEGLQLFARQDGFDAPIKHARTGGLVGVLVDQHAGDKGVWTPLFGRLASTSPLAAMLALRTGATLLTAAINTAGPARWKLVVDQVISTHDCALEELTARINRCLERQIERNPADWFWVHNRWKTPKPKFLLQGYRRGVYLPEDQPVTGLKPFRMVIRSSNWLGDAVMSVPAIKAIKHGRPDAHITILCRQKIADLWKVVPEVDEVIPLADGEGLLKVSSKLRNRFDVGIVLPNSLRTGLELWLAGLPRRVGYAGHARRWLLNQIVPEPQAALRAEHHVHRYMRLAKHIGATSTEIDIAVAGLATRSNAPHLRIGLCPGAEYGPAKRWPAEKFATVATAISQRRNCEWLIFGTASDKPIADEIEQAIDGRVTNLAGQTSMAELIAELASCRTLLTNDTGTMHLASLLGVPVVAIFGSTEPKLTGPLGSGHIVLRQQVECSPCFLRNCPLDFRCMNSVEIDTVVESVLRQIAECVASPTSNPA